MPNSTSRTDRCFTRREPLADYLACADYVSSSALRRFSRSGQTALSAMRPMQVPKEATLGDALHALLLEPERFDETFFTTHDTVTTPPPPDPETLMGRTWLSRKDCTALEAMRDSVLRYTRSPLADWLERGEREISIYWTDDAGGRWKARPDCLCDDVVVELKTTTDIRPNHFLKSRKRFGYDLQAAHYVDGVRHLTGRSPRFVYVAVESVRPHAVWVLEPELELLSQAAANLQALRERFRTELAALSAEPAPASTEFA
jgi:hypothetical protein